MKDVLILGSGAGGGPLALDLSRAGLDVVVLEKGPRHPREAYDHQSGLRPGAFIPDLSEEPHTVVTRKTTHPLVTHLGWIATCVGGGTVHMGGYFYRFHPDDFRLQSRFGDYEEIADWPIGYDDLEPFYTRAEGEIGVSGTGGSNPFEGPRSKAYPMPPLRSHPIAGPIEEACRKRGWHPFPTPRSINSVPYQGRPACAYCAICASFGCPVGARGSTQEALIPRAEATGRCEVRPLSMAKEILLGKDGRARGCVYLDAEGDEHVVEARVVCVCCSAVESARLLLLSRSARFPRGLANGSGRVGRHLQFHGVTMGRGRLPLDADPGALLADPHPFVGRSVMDHYFLPDGVSDLAKGGILRFGRLPQIPENVAAGPDHLYFEGFHDYLPNEETFVDLDSDLRDKWDLPVARIHLGLPGHHRRAGIFLTERAFEIFDDLGASELTPTDIGGTSAYLVQGTCRMGNDPETSVLDADCRAHEVPNLYVVDGSCMPTSGGAPPTLTILANSFRVAARIVERFRAGEL